VLKLVVAVTLIGSAWLFLFPTLARRTGAIERIRRHEQKGIDPSAMFYTDLPIMLPAAETRRR